jgi:hypothetical protein
MKPVVGCNNLLLISQVQNKGSGTTMLKSVFFPFSMQIFVKHRTLLSCKFLFGIQSALGVSEAEIVELLHSIVLAVQVDIPPQLGEEQELTGLKKKEIRIRKKSE